MPPRIARPPLCLFCALAWEQSPRRLRPLLQVARRSAAARRPTKAVPLIRFTGLKLNPESRNANIQVDDLVPERLQVLKIQMLEPESLARLKLDEHSFEKKWKKFEQDILLSLRKKGDIHSKATMGKSVLDSQLRYKFYSMIYGQHFTKAEIEQQKALADLRYPGEWYPMARWIHRKVILHVGPTNSGKTYHALKRLEEADTGVYLGPLRLLAHEVYARMNAKGIPCSLITGEEMRIPEGDPPRMESCTVEMAPLLKELDVAVIDEIQMLNHPERGWAWTGALLGLRAKEIHVCGEERAVPIIRELCALVGDEVEIHRYDRLTPLQVSNKSLNDNFRKNLQKGDCVVSFSIVRIHELRKQIENVTGKKVAIVYGSLPPETRAQQAKLFNDPDNEYDFLVASDAIGMGLNLNIKRVIFESLSKSNGFRLYPLTVSEVKQIAGRAGRYKTAHQAVIEDAAKLLPEPAADSTARTEHKIPETTVPSRQSQESNIGFATTLESSDLKMLKHKMSSDPEPITSVGIFPPPRIIEAFAHYFPDETPLSYVLLRLYELAGTNSRFYLTDIGDVTAILDTIHHVPDLSIVERLVFSSSPANIKDPVEKHFLIALAECVAQQKDAAILDLPWLPLEILDETPNPKRQYLRGLEGLHKCLVLYLWLSYRFPHILNTRALAEYTKLRVENAIEHALTHFNYVQPLLIKPNKTFAIKRPIFKESGLDAGPASSAEEVLEEFIDYNASILPKNRARNLRFGKHASIKEIAAAADGYSERVQLLRKHLEDVKRGSLESGINLNIERPVGVPMEVMM